MAICMCGRPCIYIFEYHIDMGYIMIYLNAFIHLGFFYLGGHQNIEIAPASESNNPTSLV